MTKTQFFLSLGFGVALLAGQGAQAQQARNCAPHAVVLERLADGYGESRQAIALGADNTVVETFANIDSGSWTITVTQPGGLTCLVAHGQAFQLVAEMLPNMDAPA